MTVLPELPEVVEDWRVDLCDADFVRVHELLAGSFSGVVRRNAPGQWRVEMPLDALSAADAASVETVRVTRDGETVFAGWVERLPSGGGGTVRRVSASGRRLVFEGVDAWWPMAARLVFPDPATSHPWVDAYDVRTGRGSTVAAEFVEANLGSTALPERQWPDLVVVDPLAGSSGTWSARFGAERGGLAALVGQICDESGIVCRPTVDAAGRAVVRFGSVRDLSLALILADVADLSESEVSMVPAGATWVLAAGQGEGASRVFASVGDATGRTRVEVLTEQTSATTLGQLERIAEAVRRDEGVTVSVAGAVSELASRRIRYLADYQVGDTVGIQVDGVRYPSPVTSVQVSVSAGGAFATPTLGVWSPDRLQGMRRDVLGLADRLNRNIA